jgi:hypothetical protein
VIPLLPKNSLYNINIYLLYDVHLYFISLCSPSLSSYLQRLLIFYYPLYLFHIIVYVSSNKYHQLLLLMNLVYNFRAPGYKILSTPSFGGQEILHFVIILSHVDAHYSIKLLYCYWCHDA